MIALAAEVGDKLFADEICGTAPGNDIPGMHVAARVVNASGRHGAQRDGGADEEVEQVSGR
jgi:hypothetical protein